MPARLVLLLSLLVAAACTPAGGGGSTQVAPDAVGAGEPIVIGLELSVWGAGGEIEGRYSDILLFYRMAGEREYRTARPELVSRGATRESYQVVIPAVPAGSRGEIEYYIELKLDGQPSRLEGTKKIRVG